MNKYFLVLILLLFVLSISGIVVADVCNDGGGISCDAGCKTPGDYPAFDCVVSHSQIVKINQDATTNPSPSTFHFNKLTIKQNIDLHFVNTNPVQTTCSFITLNSQSGLDGAFPHPSWNGVAPYDSIWDSNASDRGGLGGEGCFDNNGIDSEGGGGGNGGNGGKTFVQGGCAGYGGSGSSRGSSIDAIGGGTAGYPGANIILHVSSLIMEDQSNISVSGQDGNSGAGDGSHTDAGDGGDGGGGGAGGSGGGRLTVQAGTFTKTGAAQLLANGGNGGNGGVGGDGNDNGDGGGGAGGGAGQYGVIKLFVNSITSSPTIVCSVGNVGGGAGTYGRTSPVGCGTRVLQGRDGSVSTPATNPACSASSQAVFVVPVPAGASESNPDGGANNISLCNDFTDNDYNGYIDAEDPACFDIVTDGGMAPSISYGPIPGPLTAPINTATYSWFSRSAFNGSDGICGDDSTPYTSYTLVDTPSSSGMSIYTGLSDVASLVVDDATHKLYVAGKDLTNKDVVVNVSLLSSLSSTAQYSSASQIITWCNITDMKMINDVINLACISPTADYMSSVSSLHDPSAQYPYYLPTVILYGHQTFDEGYLDGGTYPFYATRDKYLFVSEDNAASYNGAHLLGYIDMNSPPAQDAYFDIQLIDGYTQTYVFKSGASMGFYGGYDVKRDPVTNFLYALVYTDPTMSPYVAEMHLASFGAHNEPALDVMPHSQGAKNFAVYNGNIYVYNGTHILLYDSLSNTDYSQKFAVGQVSAMTADKNGDIYYFDNSSKQIFVLSNAGGTLHTVLPLYRDDQFSNFYLDYGYIDPLNEFLCYNYIADKNTVNSVKVTAMTWNWLDAKSSSNAYKIFTLNNGFNSTDTAPPNKTTDLISNSDQWFYCNANDNITQGLTGNKIPEYGTFGNVQSLTSMSCSYFMTMLSGQKFGVCSDPSPAPCCTGTIDLVGGTNDCDCAFGSTGGDGDLCSAASLASYPQLQSYCTQLQSTSGTGDYLEKSLCGIMNIDNCMNQSYYNPSNTCAAQPRGYGCKVNTGQICVNGSVVGASDTQNCCFGPNRACITPPSTANPNFCTENNGTVYDPSAKDCASSSLDLSDGTKCCFGEVFDKFVFASSMFNSVSNESYMCYAQNGNNKLAECCYGSDCKNINLTLSPFIDSSLGRIFGSGSPLQSVSTFDKYVPERQSIVDYVRKLSTGSTSTVISVDLYNKLAFSGFDNIEFDVAYNQMNVANLTIDGTDYGPLYQYLVGGTEKNRWHRAIVPIHFNQKNLKFTDMKINLIHPSPDPSNVFTLLIDNIFLSKNPSTAATDSSNNYYCTGGFGSWIPALSPNLTDHPFSDTIFYSNWQGGYGPYVFACNSQGSFAWTGHQCCGYNTKLNNYGEFFNDTQSGCFNGSVVPDGWTITKSKNIDELDTNSLFETYTYKGLLYYQSAFIGCQVQSGSYSTQVSYDGTLGSYPNTNQGDKLVTNYTNTQCAVVGNYYCSNGAWRQYIWTDAKQAVQFNGQQLQLEATPSGPELIKNGFTGEGTCTDGIKNQDETDVDCGGSKCPKCGYPHSCNIGTDCISGICTGGICTLH